MPDHPFLRRFGAAALVLCLAACERLNRHTDCADADGNMMPCPCRC